MSNNTNIQWTDATWNIARGCTKVSEGCKYCYMMRDGQKFGYDGTKVTRTKTVFNFPLKFKETQSKVWGGSPLIFTSSLTDFYHPDIDSYRDEAFDIINQCPHLIFQILTKRPERIDNYFNPLSGYHSRPNIWMGTSVENVKATNRIHNLVENYPGTKFISFEPLLEDVSKEVDRILSMYINRGIFPLQWAIIGGESGNDNGEWLYRSCEVQWMENLVKVLQKYHIPVFVKQLGTYAAMQGAMSDRHGSKINEFPKLLQLREFPEVI